MYRRRYDGPEFMQPHFYPCPVELKALLPEHTVHQGIQCICGSRHLIVSIRMETAAVFAHCTCCGCEFKVYANEDYPSGYIRDDLTKPAEPVACIACGAHMFQVAVGYEYPGDETESTDITWFTMAGKCSDCGTLQQMYSDETA